MVKPGTNFSSVSGTDSNVRDFFRDERQLLVFGEFTGNTPTTPDEYQIACELIKTDNSDGSLASYINVGTVAVPNFQNSSQVLSVSINMTSQQILTFQANPIVAIPGVAGKTIIVDQVIFTSIFNTIAYQGSTNVGVAFKYSTSSGPSTTAEVPYGIFTQSSGNQTYRAISANGYTIEGAPLIMCLNVVSPTAGNGTANIVIKYFLT